MKKIVIVIAVLLAGFAIKSFSDDGGAAAPAVAQPSDPVCPPCCPSDSASKDDGSTVTSEPGSSN